METKLGNNDEDTPGINGDIYCKLLGLGYAHELYKGLARLPTKDGSDSGLLFNDEVKDKLLPGFDFIGRGAENHVFYNHHTGKVNKYPKTTLTILHMGGKEIHYTQLDILIQSVRKAVETNVAAIVLQTKKLHSCAELNGVIIEDLVDAERPAEHRDLGWKAKKYFHVDPFRIKGNYFWQKDGSIAVVDGLTLIVDNATSDRQREFFERILLQETDRIIDKFPDFS